MNASQLDQQQQQQQEKMETNKLNEKIRVNYVNETYRRCLTNKINHSQPQAYHPRVKLISKVYLAKKRHLNTTTLQSKNACKRKTLIDIENDTMSTNSNGSVIINCSNKRKQSDGEEEEEETDSHFNSTLKRRRQEQTTVDLLELAEPKQTDNIATKKTTNNSVKLDEEALSIEMNEKFLWLIANNYDNLSEWKAVAINGLGLQLSDTQNIEARNLIADGLKECFYQCLLKWRVKEPENCYFNYFLGVILLSKLNKPCEMVYSLRDNILNASKATKLHEENAISRLRFYLTSLVNKKTTAINENKLKTKLDENDLWSASGYLFQEWKTICRNLNLTELDLISIEMKHMQTDGIRECCYQSLLKWSQFFYEKTSLESLCLSLIQMNLNLYAKQLLELFCF